MIDLALTGDKALMSALDQLPVAIGGKVMSLAIRAGGRVIVKAVKELAPVDSGNLKASIWQRLSVYPASETAVITIGGKWPKGAHLHLVEKGTKARYHKRTGRHVGRMPPNPFVAHAFNMSRHLALSKLEASIRRGITRETKRLAK